MFGKRKYPPQPMQTHRPPQSKNEFLADLRRKRMRLAAKEKEDETVDVMSYLDDYPEIAWCVLASIAAIGVCLFQMVTAS